VLIINGFGKKHLENVEVPICDAENLLKDTRVEEMEGIHTAILVTSEIPPDFLNSIIEEHWSSFAHLVMVSFDHQVGSVWITPYDMGGILGLEVRQNLLSDLQQRLKRAMDYFIILLFSPLLLPLIGLLALLIKLDSPGSVFYNQYRLGQYGKKIKVWKFRTMVSDADQVLEHYLKLHPDYRQEWEANHKIKNDPRVTRVGKILRRFSLDELPQLWNVLSGEMSMVGPRPIVDDEKRYYASCLRLYMQVKPGLTGLWQVSGRNDVSYEKRVQLDEYYVRNWSIWLDLYILARTFFAILGGKGAY
jgi:Undecaprenyl-phosphate galactose phosphotransferase WbaP